MHTLPIWVQKLLDKLHPEQHVGRRKRYVAHNDVNHLIPWNVLHPPMCPVRRHRHFCKVLQQGLGCLKAASGHDTVQVVPDVRSCIEQPVH